MTEVVAKKFNWKKAVSVFFGVVLFLRILMYIFSGSSGEIPSCNSDFSKNLVNKLLAEKIAEAEDDDIEFNFFNFKEVSSSSTARICKVRLTVSDGEETQTVTKTFNITKSKTTEGKYYIRIKDGFEE